ncbi:MAG: RNA ligase [Candidatus Sericytochromatia bacterium]
MAKIDLNQFNELIEQGYINVQTHDSNKLKILNYTPKTQYERNWNDLTIMSRGLIIDNEGNIIARPFKKFFNLEEHTEPLPNEAFDVFDKLDGSLGILYFLDDKPFIATRGSFNSVQAIRANKILQNKYSHIKFKPEFTYLFEIIFPENRIVVDYKGLEDIILLAIIETDTNNEIDLYDFGLPLVKRFDGIKDINKLRELQDDTNEGFVIKFKSGFRIKLKFQEYVRLHRIITSVSSKMIWEHLKDNKPLDDILDRVPDEFFKWVKDTVADLQNKYKKIEEIAKSEFKELEDRKTTAQYFSKCSYPAILFKMLDKRDYSEIIWKILKPKYEKPFVESEE